MALRDARHNVKLQLHLILHRERPQKRGKGRKPQIRLLQGELALRQKLIRAQRITHRHAEHMHLVADADLHARHEAARVRLQGLGAHCDLRIMLRVQNRGPQHVPASAFSCGVGNICGEVRALRGAQLRLIDRE